MTEGTGDNTVDPYRLARQQAEAERLKRFYTDVSVVSDADGFSVRLDGRPVRTPGKAAVVLPRRNMAVAVAAEWDAQTDYVRPGTMPLSRLVNTAIDGVVRERDAVIAQTAHYILSDLVCYRAEHPQGLVARQAEQWDPLVRHVGAATGVKLKLATGIIAITQDPALETALQDRLRPLDHLELTGAASVATLTVSTAILLAVLDRVVTPDAAWHAAHVDEDWNIAQWGEDAEAAERRRLRRAEFDAAILLLGL